MAKVTSAHYNKLLSKLRQAQAKHGGTAIIPNGERGAHGQIMKASDINYLIDRATELNGKTKNAGGTLPAKKTAGVDNIGPDWLNLESSIDKIIAACKYTPCNCNCDGCGSKCLGSKC